MPNCVHLIDDARQGGVLTNLKSLQRSSTTSDWKHHIELVTPRNPATARGNFGNRIVVHFSISWSKLPYLIALRALNPKAMLLLQEHHYSPEHFAPTPRAARRFRWLCRFVARIFDGLIGVSEAQAAWYQTLISKPVKVIPPMCDLDSLLNLPPKPHTDRLVVGISGRLNTVKGIDVALQLLEHDIAGHFDFLFAGYGELADGVEQAARKFSNVRFMGAYEHPLDYLQQCDLVLIPSRLDTYGLSALEARAAAKPIIVTQTCGLTEQASNCGIAAKPGCAQSLADALDNILQRNSLTEFASHARHTAKSHNIEANQRWTLTLTGS